MERQLVQHGASTLMVSLPKPWLDKQQLRKGDSVHIVEAENRLIITEKEKKREDKHTDIHFSHNNYSEIRNILGKLYREGYNSIGITYNNPKCLYSIQIICTALQGFEIIEQSDKGCLVKNVVREISINIDEMMSKVINIIKTEFIVVREYLKEGIKGKEDEIRTLRDDCWKYRNMVYLQLKESILSLAFEDYFIIHLAEYNASFLYWLYRSFDKSNIEKVSAGFLTIYDEVQNYFNNSIHKVNDKDYVTYIMDTRDKLLKESEQYALKNSSDRFLIIYLTMIIQNLQNHKTMVVA